MIPSFDEIKAQALALGWDDVGITTPEIPQEDIDAYLAWLEADFQGDLTYMKNAIRCDPQQLLPGAKTAIVFISNYKKAPLPFIEGEGLIASYARGRDYHQVHQRRIKKFIRWLSEYTGTDVSARGFSDSKPILEKALAVKAGLGWFGKNTLLIHRRFGTFILLSGILTTLEIPLPAVPNLRLPKCGICTKCLDVCPTGALIDPYILNATLCLSYHLIEAKGDVPEEIKEKNPGYAFGCDLCQDVCPHNVRSPLSVREEFSPEQGIGNYLNAEKLLDIKTEPTRLYGTPLKRRGVEGLQNNLSPHRG